MVVGLAATSSTVIAGMQHYTRIITQVVSFEHRVRDPYPDMARDAEVIPMQGRR